MAGSENIILLVFLFAAFYFLMLRPQRARARAVAEVRANLQVGAEVLTTAGMHARVAAVDDEAGTVLLEMAPGITARYEKAAVGRVLVPGSGTAPPAEPQT